MSLYHTIRLRTKHDVSDAKALARALYRPSPIPEPDVFDARKIDLLSAMVLHHAYQTELDERASAPLIRYIENRTTAETSIDVSARINRETWPTHAHFLLTAIIVYEIHLSRTGVHEIASLIDTVAAPLPKIHDVPLDPMLTVGWTQADSNRPTPHHPFVRSQARAFRFLPRIEQNAMQADLNDALIAKLRTTAA